MSVREGKFVAFGRAVDRCESPIERRFLVALLFSERFSFEPVSNGSRGVAVDRHGVVLGQQVPIAGYRLDFAMRRRGATQLIAIEIDGFHFHDRTPEDATRDRVRDRKLVANGWLVVRFTGKEIIQDALACARQAHELVLTLTAKAVAPRMPLVKTTGQLELPNARIA